MPDLDIDLVRHALGVARKHGFGEVELRVDEGAFFAKLLPGVAAPADESDLALSEPQLIPIKADLVGYYREVKKPLAVGASIKAGDVVAVVAALGIANDVESKVSGEVVEVLVEPGQPVEYGQVLARVRQI